MEVQRIGLNVPAEGAGLAGCQRSVQALLLAAQFVLGQLAVGNVIPSTNRQWTWPSESRSAVTALAAYHTLPSAVLFGRSPETVRFACSARSICCRHSACSSGKPDHDGASQNLRPTTSSRRMPVAAGGAFPISMTAPSGRSSALNWNSWLNTLRKRRSLSRSCGPLRCSTCATEQSLRRSRRCRRARSPRSTRRCRIPVDTSQGDDPRAKESCLQATRARQSP